MNNLLNKKPLTSLIIEVTNKCNLSCTICPVNNGLMKREKKHITYEIFEKAIKENLHFEKITLSNWGEPFLHPEIFDFINLSNLYHENALITLSTNGTLLSESIIDSILSSRLNRIQISIDGMQQNYEKIRQFDYTTLLQNLNLLIKKNSLLGKTKKLLRVSMVINETNQQDFNEFKKFWENKVDFVRFQAMVDYNTLENRKEVCNWLMCKEYGQLVVLSDGTVVPCCADFNGELSLGNVLKTTLQEIWLGDQLALLRNNQLSGLFAKTCSQCLEFESNLVNKRF